MINSFFLKRTLSSFDPLEDSIFNIDVLWGLLCIQKIEFLACLIIVLGGFYFMIAENYFISLAMLTFGLLSLIVNHRITSMLLPCSDVLFLDVFALCQSDYRVEQARIRWGDKKRGLLKFEALSLLQIPKKDKRGF